MNKNALGYIAVVIFLSITCFLSLNLYATQRTDHDLLDISTFPNNIGAGWKGTDLTITEKEYNILETRNLFLRKYVNASEDPIYLLMVYSETNRSVFHPPEVCFTGSGVTILDKTVEKVRVGGRSFTVNKMIVEEGGKRELAYYCYKAGNLYLSNFYLHQIKFSLNQILGTRKGGATIRITAPLKDGSPEKALTFLKEVIKELDILS